LPSPKKHLARPISPNGATVQDRVKYYRNSYALDRMALLFDHLERPIITPNHTILANVNSRSLCCGPFVCLSSVCNARAPYSVSREHDSQEVEIFGNISITFVTLAIR